MSLHIEVTKDTLSPALAQLAGGPLHREMILAAGAAVLGVAQRAFRDPSARAAPWPARSSGGGHPLLLLSGTLRNSLHATVSGDTVKVGSPTKYAALQQLGGTIVPKTAKKLVFSAGGKKVFASKVTVPARPFLPFSESGQLTPMAEREIDEALEGLIDAAGAG